MISQNRLVLTRLPMKLMLLALVIMLLAGTGGCLPAASGQTTAAAGDTTSPVTSPAAGATTAALISSAVTSQTAETTPVSSGSAAGQQVPLDARELELMYSDPDQFKGRLVDIYAVIFTDVEHDATTTYIQAFQDPVNSERNTIIAIDQPDLAVADGDIIRVTGRVVGRYEGQNALGGTVTAALVKATHVEKSDYQTAFAPSLRTIEVNQQQNQHGYVIKIIRVEIAKSETRVYLKITNKTSDEISLYTYSARLIQGKKQYETQTNYEANYPQLQTDLLPDVVETGLLVFDPIRPDGGSFRIYLDGSSSDWDISIKPFVFSVAME